MANENNKIKLLLLWDILSKNTDENHAMNADEIREELATTRARWQSQINFITKGRLKFLPLLVDTVCEKRLKILDKKFCRVYNGNAEMGEAVRIACKFSVGTIEYLSAKPS